MFPLNLSPQFAIDGVGVNSVCLDETDDIPPIHKIWVTFDCDEDTEITVEDVKVTKCGIEESRYPSYSHIVSIIVVYDPS